MSSNVAGVLNATPSHALKNTSPLNSPVYIATDSALKAPQLGAQPSTPVTTTIATLPTQRPLPNFIFGPTPLPTQPLVTTYHGARSPYSLAQADSRARWRFIHGLLWALVAWLALGTLVAAKVAGVGERDGADLLVPINHVHHDAQ